MHNMCESFLFLLFDDSGTYDGGEHTPKLLPCSHTVCLHCLLRIAAQNVQATSFRCPICRESITIPRGGVPALPPSFLVNQLLDLMASHRREVIPKCSIHIAQVRKLILLIITRNYFQYFFKMKICKLCLKY